MFYYYLKDKNNKTTRTLATASRLCVSIRSQPRKHFPHIQCEWSSCTIRLLILTL